MILQELLRNIVFYKNLINPLLQVVKENMFTLCKFPNVVPNSSMNLSNDERNGLLSLEKIKFSFPSQTISYFSRTMTHTIPTKPQKHEHYKVKKSGKSIFSIATNSKVGTIVLVGVGVHDWTMESTQTILSTQVLGIGAPQSFIFAKQGTTTGFIFEKTVLYFSHETHEKREYLGEFSLTHEEIHINNMKERG